MPVPGRFQSAHVLDVHGRLFLIDCGEGTQHQLMKYRISPLKLDSLFVSHIHGDHIFGLFGLMSTLAMKGKTAPLDVYGPANLSPVLKFFLSFYGGNLPYEIHFHPVSAKAPEVIYQTKSMEILAFPLNHKIETYGYLFREKTPPMNVRKDALEKYGFTLTEIGMLKRGEDVVRPAGADTGADFMNGFVRNSGTDKPLLIKNSEAAYIPYIPRSYAYVSDTAPFPELSGWVKGVDLLYHETTYLKELADQAVQRFHSTTIDAATCAREAGAGKLVIGHYSSRCQDKSLYEREAREVFSMTFAADDGDIFDIPDKIPSL